MRTFLKISLRHLWQSRLYSSINMIGLATGITCILLAVLYWKDEHSFDDFHNGNLYRVTTTLIEGKGNNAVTLGGTGQVQGPAFIAAIPEIKSYTRVLGGDIYNDISAGDKVLHLQPLFVDENFLKAFNFKLLQGDPKTAFNGLEKAVITERTAMKFFNRTNVVGKLLNIDADPSFERLGKPLIVSGVIQDPPANSSMQFDLLLTFNFMQLSFEDNSWMNAYLGTFVTLQPASDKKVVTKKLQSVFEQNAKSQLADHLKNYNYNPQISYGLQPMADIHLNPLMRGSGNAEGGIINGSNPLYSYLFLGIAGFILLMATINFININIASSLKRSKEIGIRKITGGSRAQIIVQLLCESAMLCLLAFIISLIATNSLLPLFNKLTGKQIVFNNAINLPFLLVVIALLVSITLATGGYPAYVLSNFKPAEVLYNKQKLSGKNWLGRGLVVVQFSLAIFLLISTIVYYGQMNFLRTKDLGYNPNQIIRTSISGNKDYQQIISQLKAGLSKEPSIKMVSFGSDGYVEDIDINNTALKAVYRKIDENFIPALGIPLQAGHNFSAALPAGQKQGVIVNEALVKALGLQHPIGLPIKINRHWDSSTSIITGVVKDFHFGSLREPVRPMAMYMPNEPDGGIWIKFEKTRQKEAMTAVERIYKKAMPNSVYTYNFLDELNARQYLQEQRWQQVVTVATLLSFIICCLGLFGLAHLSTGQRVKEIGIRKVLGASVAQIVSLLSADFLKLVAIAFLVAAPIGWVVMDKWLQDFAYRITIGPSIFLMTGLLAILIALMAVGYQSVKTAMANPVKSLRSE